MASALGAPSSVLVGVAPPDALKVLSVIALIKASTLAPFVSLEARDDPDAHARVWVTTARDVLGPLPRAFWRRHDNLALSVGCLLQKMRGGCPSMLEDYALHIVCAAAQGYVGLPAGTTLIGFYAAPPSRPCHPCAHDGVSCLVSGWRGRCLRCEASGWSCSFAAVRSVSCEAESRPDFFCRCRLWMSRSTT